MSRIYRGISSVDFNTSPVVDSAGYVRTTRYMVRHQAAGIDSPEPDSMGTIQDTGKAVEITLTGQILNRSESVRRKLREIVLADSVSDSSPHGVIGFEIDEYPEWNVAPSADRGAVIMSAEFSLPENEPSKIEFVINLRVYGGRGAWPAFDWD